MKNDPRFGGRQSWYFWNKRLHLASINRPWWCNNGSASWPWQCWSSRKINKIHLRALTRNFDYSHPFQKMVLAVRQNIESQLYVSKQSNRPRIKKQKNSSALDELNSNWSSYNSKTWPWQIKRDRWKGRSMEKQTRMEEQMGSLGVAKSRLRLEPRHAFKFAKIPLRKRTFKEYIAKKMSDRQQTHPLWGFRIVREKKMIFSEAKPEMKAKDDKMLILERYFESCRRDLSRCLS